jgi:hypothetical protein
MCTCQRYILSRHDLVVLWSGEPSLSHDSTSCMLQQVMTKGTECKGSLGMLDHRGSSSSRHFPDTPHCSLSITSSWKFTVLHNQHSTCRITMHIKHVFSQVHNCMSPFSVSFANKGPFQLLHLHQHCILHNAQA